MLSRDEIINILNDGNNFVDGFILDAFIKNWKIEAIYEDENGVEFYDEAAFEKIKSALCSKNEKENELYDVEVIQKDEPTEVIQDEPESDLAIQEDTEVEPKERYESGVIDLPKPRQDNEMQHVTLDITGQTLSVLAHSIAEKISGDISGYLKNTKWFDESFEAGGYKKDNEILSSKLKELLEDNKILIKRIQELESELDSYHNVVANIYVKKR